MLKLQRQQKGKYRALRDYLAAVPANVVTLSFAQVEAVLEANLPPSARLPGWWANYPGHSQAQAWLSAGWVVSSMDRRRQVVTFGRQGESDPKPPAPREP